ncbi:hypothetical protein B0H13DRAFT_1888576 [Mycena leptocephala]|nr:hypothetical protein B0H13DRAFT_1888576 [Mycena leptocephala]
MHEENMRQILRAINKRAACELPTTYKRLQLIDFKRWVMPPVSPQRIADFQTARVYGVDGVLFAARVSCSESVPGVQGHNHGERAKPDIGLNFVEQDSEADVLNGVADFLSRFALTINGELANLQQLEEVGTDEYEHWNGLRDTWLTEVNLLKGALENLSPGTAEEGLREDGIKPAILRLK